MREVQNYGRHAGDEDVKIYRGKEKPPRRPAAESSPQPKASKPQKKRQARDFRDVNWKDIALPVVAIAALVLVWMLPTTGWVRAVSFLIPYLIGGFDGVMAALERLANKEFLHKEPLTVLASFAAFAVGAYGEAVLLVLLLKVCGLVESAAVNRGRKETSTLLSIRPDSAKVETAEGILEITPDYVNIGDIIVVDPGERIPLDGVILEGISAIDLSPLAGKSKTVAMTAGYRVLSGCINVTSSIRVRVDTSFEDSTVNRLLRLAEKAPEGKSLWEQRIGQAAKFYTPLVFIAALLLAIVPAAINGQWAEYIRRAVVLLIAAYPGELLVSVPLAFYGCAGCMAKNGVFVKSFRLLDALASADTFVFDKTGTITEGRFAVTDVFPEGMSEQELLGIASTAEQLSTHPIALALREASSPFALSPDDELNTADIPGRGVRASVGSKEILVGNAALLEENGIGYKVPSRSGGAVHVAVNGKYCGHILITDRIKRNAYDALENLRMQGVKKTVMLTGDVLSVARPIASKLNFDMLKAELTPEEKLAAVEYLIDNKGGASTVAFVGDGINDGLVLRGADVGIAMGALGSAPAMASADILLMDKDIGKLPLAVRAARRTGAVVKLNVAVAAAVKLLLVAGGAAGLIPIILAAAADAVVFTACMIYSLRPLRAWEEEEQ